jgi:hypothetical protein
VRQVERSGRRCLLRVRSQAEEINGTFGSPEAVPADRLPVDGRHAERHHLACCWCQLQMEGFGRRRAQVREIGFQIRCG